MRAPGGGGAAAGSATTCEMPLRTVCGRRGGDCCLLLGGAVCLESRSRRGATGRLREASEDMLTHWRTRAADGTCSDGLAEA